MVERAGAHGLGYLAEADVKTMVPGNFGPRVAEYLAEKGNGAQVLTEQYLDFALNRTFRESLLVHSERAGGIRYQVDPGRYRDLHVAARTPVVDGPSRLDRSRQEYAQSDGATLFTNDPGVKATLETLNAGWPWTQSRQQLVDSVRARMRSAGLVPSEDVEANVDDLVGTLIMQGQARFRLDPVSPGPRVGPLRLDEPARRMAELTAGDAQASPFTFWHETLVLSAVDRHVLPLLDGTRDRDALVHALTEVARADPAVIAPEVVAAYVDALPRHLAELELL